MDLPPRPKTSTLAIVSLATSLLCIAPAGIICGHIALSDINKSFGQLTGRRLALTGITIGYISVLCYFLAVPVLFIGARAWKKSSDRAACVINQRNVQCAMRGLQGMQEMREGQTLTADDIRAFMKLPTHCPSGGEYEFLGKITPIGTLVLKCPHAQDGLQHQFKNPQ
jgi:Domain of unknown function (DUF4190)